MNKKVIISVIVLVVIAGIYMNRQVAMTAKVTMVEGEATVVSGGSTQPAEVGMEIPVGAVIHTEAGAKIDVLVKDECAVRLNENGEAALSELSQNGMTDDYQISVELRQGELLNRIDGLADGSDFTVKTPTAVCGVRGTHFGVTVEDEGTEVGVLKGEVEIAFGDGQTRTLTRDQIISVYARRPASDVRQLTERARSRLKPVGYLNFQEVVTATKVIVDIANAQTIKTDLEIYLISNGSYPNSLRDVYGQEKNDNFGHPWIYERHGNSYFLASRGEDGIPGNGDDIIVKE